jgi:hypothetical protein
MITERIRGLGLEWAGKAIEEKTVVLIDRCGPKLNPHKSYCMLHTLIAASVSVTESSRDHGVAWTVGSTCSHWHICQ